jgi:hypothetical protein
MATASLETGLRPRRVFHIQVEDLLNQVMSPDSLVWVSQDMPAVYSVYSIISPLLGARAYLAQWDSRALTRSALTRYYPEGYWSQSSLGILQSVLDKLGSSRFSDIRATYLNLVWDHAATGRQTGLFSGRPAEVCPLCGIPDSLDHVVLRCQVLSLRRQEIRRDTSRPYERGASPSFCIPFGCPAWVRNYLRSYLELAFNVEGSIADHDALAMWVARPQKSSLEWLDGASPLLLSVSELRYLRKELLSILCKLLYGARCLWRLRCQEVFQPASGFTFMSCYRNSPRVIQLGISTYLSSQGGADPFPAPGSSPSALSDGASFILVDAAEGIEEDDLPFPPAAAEIHAAVLFNGDSLVRSSYADDPDLVHLVSVVDLRRALGSTALDFSWFAFGDASSLGSFSPLEGEHPLSGSLSREPLAGKLPWGFIPRRDPNLALHTRDKDHDYRHSWVQSSHFCVGGGMVLFF